MTIEADLVNHAEHPFSGVVHYRLGEVSFEQHVTTRAGRTEDTWLSIRRRPALFHVKNPELWWPVGYGDPYLYDAEIEVQSGGRTVDKKAFKAGLRQMTFSEEGTSFGSGSTDADSSRAAETGDSASRCCATGRANTMRQSAITVR